MSCRKTDNPSKKTCDMVDRRDGYRCVRCGRSLYAVSGSRHHRMLRKQAPKSIKHNVENLILLCGSGDTGCHGYVHANPAESYGKGWMVKSYEIPASKPLLTFHGWVLLHHDGTMTPYRMEKP